MGDPETIDELQSAIDGGGFDSLLDERSHLDALVCEMEAYETREGKSYPSALYTLEELRKMRAEVIREEDRREALQLALRHRRGGDPEETLIVRTGDNDAIEEDDEDEDWLPDNPRYRDDPGYTRPSPR